MDFKKLTTTLLLIIAFHFSNAQFVNDYGSAAEKYYAAGDFFSAATYYEKFLNVGKSKTGSQSFQPYDASARANRPVTKSTSLSREQAIYKLAESYRMLHYHEKALPWYKEATTFPATSFPLSKFHYATTLKALQKYDEASVAFNEFLQNNAEATAEATEAKRELKNIAFIQSEMAKTTLSQYTVVKASGLNADGGSYAPMWAENNTLWFTSTRAGTGSKNQNKIYAASYQGDVQGAVSLVNLPTDADLQQGVTAMLPGGNIMFYTKWDVAKQKTDAAIYKSSLQGGDWSTGVLEPNLNVAGSKTQQPFVTADGKQIIFSSNRAGGQGGFDLWMASLDATGNAGSPVNMGATINTAYDEQAPFYHEASRSLVFSSNGGVGMGGYDFFYSTGGLDNLSAPVNFGHPVNSNKDDLYFTSKGGTTNILESVIMSSDRDAACCLELFSLSKVKPIKQLMGKVVSCETGLPLAGAQILLVNSEDNKTILDQKTDATGMYSYSVPDYSNIKATGNLEGYFSKSMEYSGPENKDEPSFSIPTLCLSIIPEKAITVQNVYYDFNKATLQEQSFASLDDLVKLLNDNPTMEIELSAHTDSKGSDDYNMALSQRRAQTVVDYLIEKGIDKNRLVPQGYGETMPIAANENADGTDNEAGRQQNRRTEFKILKK